MAILKYFVKCGINPIEYREKTGEKIFEASFSSDRKRMSTVVKINGKTYSFIKGASEYMVEISSNFEDFSNGQKNPISADMRK